MITLITILLLSEALSSNSFGSYGDGYAGGADGAASRLKIAEE